jgi:hypothetical protein
VLGYHGCDKEVGESLLSGRTNFLTSKNQHDWLGHGIYFWENNPKRALDWAHFMSKHDKFKNRVKKPFVVGAIIDLGNCLDLTEAISLELVEFGYNSLKELFALEGKPLPENKPGGSDDEDLIRRNLDCAVINHVHDLRESGNRLAFNTVRGAFHEGEPLYPGAGIRRKTHIQIAVRSTENIQGIFRVNDFGC